MAAPSWLPTPLEYQYTSAQEVADLLSDDAVALREDDDQSGTESTTELARLVYNAVNYATDTCNLYLQKRYPAAQLAQSWKVHDWATTLASVWLCRRRGNPVPKSLQQAMADAVEQMQAVHDLSMSLPSIAERESDQPVLSNVTLDNRFHVKQIRVQRPLSTKRQTPIPGPSDFQADIIGPLEDYPR